MNQYKQKYKRIYKLQTKKNRGNDLEIISIQKQYNPNIYSLRLHEIKLKYKYT